MAMASQKQGFGSFQEDETEFLASSLDIFQPPKSESEIVSGKEVLIRPVNSLTDDGPHEFNVISADKEYIQMPMTRLISDIQIVKMDNGVETDAQNGDDYSVINLLGNSIYRQLEVYLNDCQLMDFCNKPIKMIVYSVYHMQLLLDKDRNAKVEYVI